MSLDPVLISYFAAYALVLATPGPNMLLIGALATMKGLRGVVPIAIGLGFGGIVLGVAIYVMLGLIPDAPGWQLGERLVSAVLLAWMGVRIMRAPPVVDEAASISEHGAEFALGVCTALSNPVTLAFFASQMLGPLGDREIGPIAPLLLVTGLLALGKALAVACVFSHRALRQRALRWLGPVKIAIGALFIVLAALRIAPLLSPSP